MRRLATLLLACVVPTTALYLSVGWRPPTQNELLWSDLPWYFTPTFAVLHRALTEGFLPLWNPWQLAGWPFLAAFQTQAAYPPAWMVAWLEPHLAVTIYSWGHWAWAIAGVIVLGESLGLAWWSAAVAAIAYGFSGPVAGAFFTHSAGLAVASWLPWCALAARRVVTAENLAEPVATMATVFALALLSGAPEHFFYMTLTVGGVTTLSLIGDARGPFPSARVCGGLALALGISVLLCALQIIPTIELMREAVRSVDTFDADYISRFRADGNALLQAVLTGRGGIGRISIAFVPLAAIAVVRKRSRAASLTMLFLGGVTLDYLRGTDGVVFPFAYNWLPFVSSFRTQVRGELAWSFFASIILGIGTEGVLRIVAENATRRHIAGCTVFTLVLFDSGSRALSDRIFLPLQDPTLVNGDLELSDAIRNLPPSERIFLDYTSPKDGFHSKFGEIHGRHQMSEYDALIPAAYARVFEMPPEKPWMGLLRFKSHTKDLGTRVVTVPGVKPFMLDRFATRYYLTRSGPQPDWLAKFIQGTTIRRGKYTVVERPTAVPRAYVVHRTEPVPTKEAALERFKAEDFDPHRTVLLTGTDLPTEPIRGDEPRPQLQFDEPNRVEVRAECNSRCVLVMTDLNFPGWTALVDGVEVPIVPANYLFRAVGLSPGPHLVTFVYAPQSVWFGAMISCTGCMVVLALLAIAARRRGSRIVADSTPQRAASSG